MDYVCSFCSLGIHFKVVDSLGKAPLKNHQRGKSLGSHKMWARVTAWGMRPAAEEGKAPRLPFSRHWWHPQDGAFFSVLAQEARWQGQGLLGRWVRSG